MKKFEKPIVLLVSLLIPGMLLLWVTESVDLSDTGFAGVIVSFSVGWFLFDLVKMIYSSMLALLNPVKDTK